MENTKNTKSMEHMVKCICYSIRDKKNYLSKYYDHIEIGYLFDSLDMKKEYIEQIIRLYAKLFNKKIKSIGNRDLPDYINLIKGTCQWFETDDPAHYVLIGPYANSAMNMYKKK